MEGRFAVLVLSHQLDVTDPELTVFYFTPEFLAEVEDLKIENMPFDELGVTPFLAIFAHCAAVY